MKCKKMEKLNIEPSLLGFGCMRFPLLANGSIDEVEAEIMLDEAIANGVTYIDTAFPYHNGESEPFVGRVLNKFPRSSYFLATKLPVWKLQNEAEVKATFELQLQRLDKDYVDFYLLHALDKEKWEKVKAFHVIPFLEEMKRQGKIKYLGFSFHDEYEIFEEIINAHDWDFCQIQLNYMDTNLQAGLRGYELTKEKNIPLVIMEPIKGGRLINLPDEIKKVFLDVDPHASMASWALRWVGSFENVKVILSGMSTMEQVQDNIHTFDLFQVLNEQEQQAIQQVSDALHARVRNGCTGCEYCMPCPFGVNIPKNFTIWNHDGMYQEPDKAKEKYSELKDEQASKCQQCGACEAMCPQAIHIRDDLAKISHLYK